MIRIKSKLMIFFSAFIVLLSSVFVFLYIDNINMARTYDQVLHRFFLLNELYQDATDVNDAMNRYVLRNRSGDETLKQYETAIMKLNNKQDLLVDILQNDHNQLLVDNYSNMIDSYMTESRQSLIAFDLGNQDAYYAHLKQSGEITRYIQETTLTIINSELTDYRNVFELISRKNENFRYLGVFVFSSVAILCMIFAYWFSNGITKPIQQLTAAANRISRGNFEGEVTVNTRDEMRFLATTFNNMRSNIRDLVVEIKQKSELDQLVKKMELKSLQNQINPHFLFNTLNMVSKMAYVESAERTSELVDSVSTLLRYNLKKMNYIVQLRDEVNIVKEYLFIQRMRFDDRVAFTDDIEERALDCLLPPLTLQPFIENAFTHGVESYEQGGKLHLAIYESGNDVIVEVQDNGVGIDPETIARLSGDIPFSEHTPRDSEKEREPVGSADSNSNGIAIRNVQRRLQLFYRRNDVIEIMSEQGKGTTIKLRLTRVNNSKEEILHA